ncbi:MAG TPA: SRPBCC domain-containing protein [Chitinophagaceae bacterium]
MTKSIQHQFFFPHTPGVVWEYLTRSELIEQWLMKNDFEPIVGYDFKFNSRPVPQLDFDGIVYCKVLEIVPQKKLTYSWKCGPGNNQITVDSIVEWTLHEKDNGTELQLDHTGFHETNMSMFLAVDEGWLKNMKKIGELINKAIRGATHA